MNKQFLKNKIKKNQKLKIQIYQHQKKEIYNIIQKKIYLKTSINLIDFLIYQDLEDHTMIIQIKLNLKVKVKIKLKDNQIQTQKKVIKI